MAVDKLKLENQICFPFYAISNAIIRLYGPLLKELGITYPQYLVLLVLWEKDELSVGDICTKLHLKTNTLTPLLQKLESKDLITRTKSIHDNRKVNISLTSAGREMESKAECIPDEIVKDTGVGEAEYIQLRGLLGKILADI